MTWLRKHPSHVCTIFCLSITCINFLNYTLCSPSLWQEAEIPSAHRQTSLQQTSIEGRRQEGRGSQAQEETAALHPPQEAQQPQAGVTGAEGC